MFRILDAMQPRIRDLNAYLDAICGKTPLKLVYEVDGNLFFTYDILKRGKFLGIVIDNTVYYAKGFARKDLFDVNGKRLYADFELSVQDILNWMKKHVGSPFSSKVHPMTDDERYRLEQHREELDETILILKRHGFAMPNSSTLAVLNENPESRYCDFFDGDSCLDNFLGYADFWFCAPK